MCRVCPVEQICPHCCCRDTAGMKKRYCLSERMSPLGQLSPEQVSPLEYSPSAPVPVTTPNVEFPIIFFTEDNGYHD